MRGRGCDLRGVWVDRVVAEPGRFADEGVERKKPEMSFGAREARAGHVPGGWSATLPLQDYVRVARHSASELRDDSRK